jgi:WD domain, G-beta repeat
MPPLVHAGPVAAVSFSPDGRLVVSGSRDKTAPVHRWRPEDLIAEACSRLTRNLTQGEWRLYLVQNQATFLGMTRCASPSQP